MKNIILLIVFALLMSFCIKKQKSKSERLFEKAFSIVQSNFIKNNEINWVDVEKSVRDSIKQFRTDTDVHNAIKYTLDFLNDDHSFFLKPNENIFLNDTLHIPEIQSRIIEKNIGYLKIPGFGGNDSLSTLFALKIREAFKELDETNDLSGWIIDLKDNNGGVGYSQPLGISPLFQDSIIGYHKDNMGKITPIECSNNLYKVNGIIEGHIDYDNSLRNKNKKIAVLLNNKTASCGESVASALKFQGKNTQIFGQKSRGLTTRLMMVGFNPSGAVLCLSNQYMCDVNKNIIEGGIAPDVECDPDKSLSKAVEWIKNDI